MVTMVQTLISNWKQFDPKPKRTQVISQRNSMGSL